MSRQLRIEYPDALYHVMSHGNGYQWIYKKSEHFRIFISVLKDVIQKYHLKLHAFVLMKNHYHLLLETPLANLSESMRKFNQDFAKSYNKYENRKGSVFRDRYKSILIEKELYYINVVRYISQNPVRKKIVVKCEEYPGSYLYWLKDDEISKMLYLEDISEYFSKENNYKIFKQWLNNESEPNPMEKVKYKYLLGSDIWLNQIKNNIKIPLEKNIKERKKYYEIFLDEDLLIKESRKFDKNIQIKIIIYFLNKYSSLSMNRIIKKIKLKSSGAGWLHLNRLNKMLSKNEKLKNQLNELEEKIIFRKS